MKKAFLYAYDKLNLGDDLFIETIVTRYKDTKFYFFSDKNNQIAFKEHKNLKVIDKEHHLTWLKKLWYGGYARYEHWLKKQCDAVVYIGGSIFIEYPNWKMINNWWHYAADNFPLYVLGSNFGPFSDDDYRKDMQDIFSKSQDVCFRDKQSYDLFDACHQIRYAPDILFSYPLSCKENKKQIFISAIHCESKDEGNNQMSQYHDDYIQFIDTVIKRYLEKNYKIVLSSFCEIEGDEKTISILKEMNPDVEVLNYDGSNRKEVLDAISHSDYVVGTRFHSIIMAMNANKPVFPIIYSSKTKNMLNDLGFEGNYASLEALHDIDFDYVNKNLEDQYIVDIELYKKEAMKHFERLDKVLK